MELINLGKAELEKESFQFKYGRTLLESKVVVEKAYVKGKLDALEKVMEFIEKDETLNSGDILAALHFAHMDTNNILHDNFGVGERINNVEHYTDKYLHNQFHVVEDPCMYLQ